MKRVFKRTELKKYQVQKYGECYEVHLHKFKNVKKEDINNII